MIINNFKLFEKLSIGSIERGEYKELLEGGEINEGILNSIVNFFSKALGGSIDKLDKLIRKYKDNETEYWEEWADTRGKLNKADALSKEAKADPVEKAKYEEQKERLKKLQAQIEIKRKDVLDSLNRQVNAIIKDSTRLKDYYEMKKAKADEQVARDSFDTIKDASKDEALKTLFDKKIKSAVEEARKRNEEFKSKYGDLSSGKFYDVDGEDSADGTLTVGGIKIKDLLTKELSELQDRFKDLNLNRLDDVNKFLEKELKKIKDKRDDDIKNIKNRVTNKEQQIKEIDDITRKTKARIENLQDKNDFIDKLVLSSKGVSTPANKIESEIKSNPEIVTPETEKELGAKGVDTAVSKAVDAVEGQPTVKKVEAEITDQVKNNFAEAKGSVEVAVGEEISTDNYNHLKNDLINAYGKLLIYYKGMKQDPPLRTMQFGLIDFASEIYAYKKKNGSLGKDLSSKELDKLLDKYSK